MKCGVVMFDLPEHLFGKRDVVSLESCWSAVAGEPARRLKSIHELRTDVIWLTNINSDVFRSLGLFKLPNLRTETWLRTRFAQIQQELGLDEACVTPNIVVETMSLIVQRVIDYAEKHYAVTPRSDSFNADFARVFNAPMSKLPDRFYNLFAPIVQHSLVFVVNSMQRTTTSSYLTVKPNRLRHAREILSTPVPSDTGWELATKIPSMKIDQWLEGLKTPFLIKMSFKNINPDLAELLSWGAGSNVSREWMTGVEWKVIREIADIEVKEVLICPHEAKILNELNILPSGNFDELSYSCGLIAELMWTSFTTKVTKQQINNTKNYTAAAAWLRAADRMIMFKHAQRLYTDNCNVGMYGAGMISMSYPEGALRHYLLSSTEHGLMPPSSKFQELKRAIES
ncbi:Uncharacterised protein [Yersinia pseudotuberculosis]|nr:Uncharacterised protein [Yersinia pseudotuberculosis]